jgi:hypothetical protein
MSKEQYPMPEPRAAVRNGDALVEFTHGGEVVGEFNFSKVLRGWWGSFKADQAKKQLEGNR